MADLRASRLRHGYLGANRNVETKRCMGLFAPRLIPILLPEQQAQRLEK